MPIVEDTGKREYLIKSVAGVKPIEVRGHPTFLQFNKLSDLVEEMSNRLEDGEVVMIAVTKIIKTISNEDTGRCDCQGHWNK